MKVRVFLVDDSDDLRSALSRRLARADQLEIVGTAASLSDAKQALLAARPDIILLGIHPRDSSIEKSCGGVKALTDAPIVIFTSFMTPALWQRARRAGAVDYIFKHIDSGRLGREIVRLANRYRLAGHPAAI